MPHEKKSKKPLFTHAALAIISAIVGFALHALGTAVPVLAPVTDAAAPVVQEAIENAPAKDDAPLPPPTADQPAE